MLALNCLPTSVSSAREFKMSHSDLLCYGHRAPYRTKSFLSTFEIFHSLLLPVTLSPSKYHILTSACITLQKQWLTKVGRGKQNCSLGFLRRRGTCSGLDNIAGSTCHVIWKRGHEPVPAFEPYLSKTLHRLAAQPLRIRKKVGRRFRHP